MNIFDDIRAYAIANAIKADWEALLKTPEAIKIKAHIIGLDQELKISDKIKALIAEAQGYQRY